MSETYLEPFLNIAVEDYYNTYVSYHYINAVPKLIVTYGGEEYELTMKTVTETALNDEGEEEEQSTTTYYVNEKEVASADYTSFFSSAANMTVESYAADELVPEGEPTIRLEYVLDDETIIIEYYAYDSNFYAVKTPQGIGLVNKLDVGTMITNLENLVVGG